MRGKDFGEGVDGSETLFPVTGTLSRGDQALRSPIGFSRTFLLDAGWRAFVTGALGRRREIR